MTALPRLTVVIVGAAGLFLASASHFSPSVLLAQQQPVVSTGTGVISGVAIDGTTKTAVPGALMSLVRDTSDGIRMPGRQILADAQGRFVFTAVPDGRFRVEGRGAGASYGAYGIEGRVQLSTSTGVGILLPQVPFNLEVRPGQRVTATVSLWRDPIVSGRVVSERGEPLRDATVRVVQWRLLAGRRSLSGTLAPTDDQGAFFVRVPPGDYLVVVTADDVFVRGVSDTSPGEQFGYQQTFYPSVPTAAGATMISVAAGETRSGLDIQMPLVRTYRIRGTVRSTEGAALPNRLTLAPADETSDHLTSRRAAPVTPDGRFVFDNILPGRYVLATLTSGQVNTSPRGGGPVVNTWVSATVDVATTDLEVTADVHRSVRISGRVTFDGTMPPGFESSNITLERDSSAGEPTDYFVPQPRVVDAAGQFSLDVLPGRFVIQGSASTGQRGAGQVWTVRSAMSGGQDLADMPFTPVRDLSNVVVTFTDRVTEVRGRIASVDRASALVVIFPADERFWSDFIVRRKRAERTAADGTFRAVGLPAGEYYACAVRGLTASDIRTGAYYATLAPLAQRITLTEGDIRTLNLDAVAAPAPRAAALAPPTLDVEAADAAVARPAVNAPPRGGSIAGRVVDATSGAPISSMRLSLFSNLDDSISTNAEGRFLFFDVAPGPHLIYSRHVSYVPTIYGARRPDEPGTPVAVAAGQRVTGLTFSIARGATIVGTVIDHNGEPISDVGVTLRQFRWQPTGRELVVVRPTTRLPSRTDAQGRFRLAGLAEGDYIVTTDSAGASSAAIAVTSPADVAFAAARPDARIGVPAPTTGVIAPATYPSAFEIARGNDLRLTVGEERTVTLQRNLVSGASVSGVVLGPDGPMNNASVQLISTDPLTDAMASRFGTTDPSGAFTISGVLPGAYTLVGRSAQFANPLTPIFRSDTAAPRTGARPPTVAALPLDIRVDGDVTGVVLSMMPTLTLTGRLRADRSDAPPQVNGVRLTASRLGTPVGSANASVATSWAADGTFTFNDLAPGRYRLGFTGPRNAALPRWIAQTAAETNVLDRGIEIGAAGTAASVELVASTTATQVSGTLKGKAGRADGVFVVLFGGAPESWTPPSLCVFATQPDQTGRFVFANVPPGAYRLAAVADSEPNQWFDPAFLATLVVRSTPVTVTTQSTDGLRVTLP